MENLQIEDAATHALIRDSFETNLAAVVCKTGAGAVRDFSRVKCEGHVIGPVLATNDFHILNTRLNIV